MSNNRLLQLGLICFGLFVLISCNSTEVGESEVEQQSLENEQEFEDEMYVDTIAMRIEDSLRNVEMNQEQPIVANRAAIEKTLRPNEDDVIMIDWNITNDIKLEQCFYEDIGEYYWCPEFGSIMKGLEGKTVALKGYVLPMDGGFFVLSMKPMASCFFCGGSGPQSIVDLKFNSPRAFKMDTHLTFKGTLRLNNTNLEELFYILDDADVYEVEEE